MSTQSVAYEKGVGALRPEILPYLDPTFIKIYNENQADIKMAHQVPYEVFARDPAAYRVKYGVGEHPHIHEVTHEKMKVTDPDMEIGVNVYTPPGEGPFPCYINFHGGGWVIGGLEDDKQWLHLLTVKANCVVVDVDYRLAPQYPFPTSNRDCVAALHWVLDNAQRLKIDTSRIAVGGASAGGHLSAYVSLYARDHNIPLVLQLLTVPVCDVRYIPISQEPSALKDIGNPYESYHLFEHAPSLPLKRMQWFADLWLGTDPEKRAKSSASWEASVITVPSIEGVAPAAFFIANVDPLRDEALAYAKRFEEAGIPAQVKVYPGVPHPFCHMIVGLQQARDYEVDTAAALNAAFYKK